MFKLSINFLRRFAGDRSGSIAMLFPLSFLPIVLLIGAVVDYGQALHAKNTIQRAADAGSRAASAMSRATEAQRVAMATSVFKANLSNTMIANVTPIVSWANGNVMITASYAQPTAFIKIAGVDSVTVRAQTDAPAGFATGDIADNCSRADTAPACMPSALPNMASVSRVLN